MLPQIGKILIYISAAIIFGGHLVALAGVVRTRIKERRSASLTAPEDLKVSLVIPCRNEASALPRLLASLKGRIDGLELVLVDDRSEDDTLKIMEAFRSGCTSAVKVIHVARAFEGRNPKQMALDAGVRASGGDVLFFTDADCRIASTWFTNVLRCFARQETGLVFGCVHPQSGKTFLKFYQKFDHLFRYFYTAGMAGLGNPSGGFGNNIAVRRAALEEIGGFEKLGFSVTEDAQLIAAIRDTGHWKIQALMDPSSTIITTPQESWRELSLQETRWTTGGIFAPDLQARLGYGAVMFYLVFSSLALPFIPLWNGFVVPYISSFSSMLLMALFSAGITRQKFLYWLFIVPAIVFSIFYYSYITLRACFKKQLEWKGSILHSH